MYLVVPLDGKVKVVDVVAEGVVLFVDLGGACRNVVDSALLQVFDFPQYRHQLQDNAVTQLSVTHWYTGVKFLALRIYFRHIY